MPTNPDSPNRTPPRFGHMLRALRGRNYTLFFFGHGLSLVGTWMQSVALSLLVWKLTHRELALGLVGFSSQILGFAMAPFAGVLSDRWDRRRLLMLTQALSMVQAILLAVLALSGVIHVWHIIVLAAFLGIVNATDIPNRQAFVVQMVEHRDHLPNAIALNSFIFNGARLIGPMIAGILIPLINARSSIPFAGEGTCLVINAASYLAILTSLWAMRLPAWTPSTRRSDVLQSLKEGIVYCFGFPPIRAILLTLATVNLFGVFYNTLLPAIAATVLHAGHTEIPLMPFGMSPVQLKLENTVGILVSSAGCGAVLGAIVLASRTTVVGFGRLIAMAGAILGLGMIGFGLSRAVWLSMPMLLLIGFGFMVEMSGGNTILQTIADDDKRGRVMSFYTLAFMGPAPMGALLGGALATHLGAPGTVVMGGCLCILVSVVFAWRLPALRRQVRPVYLRKGIIDENASVDSEA